MQDLTIEAFERYIDEYEDNTYDARTEAERDRDYFDHIQLTAEEVAALQRRKQPTSIYNRIRPKVNTLIGMEQQTRTDPKAYPRTPKHQEDAETATEAIRYVLDENSFDDSSSDAFLNLCVEGTAAVDVFAKRKKEDYKINVKNIPWDRFIYDPHARCPHFSDARFLGVAIWMDYDEAKETYPDKADEMSGDMFNSASETLDDKPSHYTDSKRKRVRVFQLYFKKGSTWHYVEFCKGVFLREPMVSPYLDEDGEPCCSLVAESANVDRNGQRFGEVRAYIGQQDEINKRRNKALHLISQRQTFSTQGVVDNVATLKAELAKPDGHLQFKHGTFGNDFGLIPTNDMAQGNLALLQDAKGEIDAQGANAALAGKMEGSASGRAIQARQQGGQLETTPLLDRHKQWKVRVYRAIWNRVRQFWTEEKWIRVTDDDNGVKFVGLNRPITRGMVLEAQGTPMPPAYQHDPRLSQVVGIENQVSELDVDIVIDEAPDVITLQQETFSTLIEFAKLNPQGMPPEVIIEAAPLQSKIKTKMLEKIKGEDEAGQQQRQQMMQEQQEAKQIAIAEKTSAIQKTQSETAKNMATAEKTQAETSKAKIDTAHKFQFGS